MDQEATPFARVLQQRLMGFPDSFDTLEKHHHVSNLFTSNIYICEITYTSRITHV